MINEKFYSRLALGVGFYAECRLTGGFLHWLSFVLSVYWTLMATYYYFFARRPA